MTRAQAQALRELRSPAVLTAGAFLVGFVLTFPVVAVRAWRRLSWPI